MCLQNSIRVLVVNDPTAWQAAPLAAFESGDVKMAVEGLPQQRIWYAVSRDGGGALHLNLTICS